MHFIPVFHCPAYHSTSTVYSSFFFFFVFRLLYTFLYDIFFSPSLFLLPLFTCRAFYFRLSLPHFSLHCSSLVTLLQSIFFPPFCFCVFPLPVMHCTFVFRYPTYHFRSGFFFFSLITRLSLQFHFYNIYFFPILFLLLLFTCHAFYSPAYHSMSSHTHCHSSSSSGASLSLQWPARFSLSINGVVTAYRLALTHPQEPRPFATTTMYNADILRHQVGHGNSGEARNLNCMSG